MGACPAARERPPALKLTESREREQNPGSKRGWETGKTNPWEKGRGAVGPERSGLDAGAEGRYTGHAARSVCKGTRHKGGAVLRLDKYLKVSRIIKRRTVANDAASGQRVSVNGRVVKPAYDVKPGDVIEIAFGERVLKVEVLSTPEHVSKEGAAALYRVLEEE